LKGKECVGIATQMEGDVLHGHKIPKNYVKVLLEAIRPNFPAEIKGPFEDDFLSIGQITAWPLNKIECI